MVASTLALLLLAPVQDEYIGVRERAWQAGLSGDVRADNIFTSGSDVDYESDIDLGGPEIFHDVTAWVKLPLLPFRGSIGGWFGSFEEDVTLSRTITFGDQVFLASTTVNAVADFRTYYLNAEFVLPSMPFGALSLSPSVGLGLRHVWAEVELTNETLGINEAQDVEGIFPVISLRAVGEILGYVRVEVELSGLAGDYGLISGRFIEGAVEADFIPMKNVFIGVGYKMVQAKLATTGDPETEVDLTLQGPFVAIGVKF
jgi:hypothetical protein